MTAFSLTALELLLPRVLTQSDTGKDLQPKKEPKTALLVGASGGLNNMAVTTTQRRRAKKAGFVFVPQPLLTFEQAATVDQWDTANRAKALGKESKERKDD